MGDAAEETKNLHVLIQQSIADGLLYISDSDARPAGGAHPQAHLWDNGEDIIDELAQTLLVRRAALDRFGPDVLLTGESSGELQRAFAPLYLHHRYQTEAVVKLIGGVDYAYSLPGDANASATPVAVAEQQRAMQGLLQTMMPETLVVPANLIKVLVPSSQQTAWSVEQPTGFTSPIFDPLASVETATEFTVSLLLHPARAARLKSQQMNGGDHPGLMLILSPLIEHAYDQLSNQATNAGGATARRIGTVITSELIALAENERAREDVRAEVRYQLVALQQRLQVWQTVNPDSPASAEVSWVASRLSRFLARPDLPLGGTAPAAAPPGSPIGAK